MPETTTIRAATRADAEFLAWAILTATRSHLARGWFDIMLNGTERTRSEFVKSLTLTRTRSLWNYSRFLIAEADDVPASALCGLLVNEAGTWMNAMLEVFNQLAWNEAEQNAARKRGSYIEKCITGSEPRAWMIENVATLPNFRRRGLAGQLIEHTLLEGKHRGADQAQITFMIGNDAAERAYAKAGFRYRDEKRDPVFEAVTSAPGLRRFVRSL